MNDTCLLRCFEGSRNRTLSHGHFAGLYYWLIAFKLSPLRAFLLSGDCLVGLERARLAVATQLCCTPPLCHAACNVPLIFHGFTRKTASLALTRSSSGVKHFISRFVNRAFSSFRYEADSVLFRSALFPRQINCAVQ